MVLAVRGSHRTKKCLQPFIIHFQLGVSSEFAAGPGLAFLLLPQRSCSLHQKVIIPLGCHYGSKYYSIALGIQILTQPPCCGKTFEPPDAKSIHMPSIIKMMMMTIIHILHWQNHLSSEELL